MTNTEQLSILYETNKNYYQKVSHRRFTTINEKYFKQN